MVPQSVVIDDVFYCRVGIVDAMGNAILHGHTIPYSIEFQGFLQRLYVDTFHPLLKIDDDAGYISWAKRLEFLSSDLAAIAKLEFMIEQHKTTDYKKLAEWLWVCPEGDFGGKLITGEKEFNTFMALARSKKLGNGCLMRVEESKYLEITETLKYLEVNEDRKGLVQCEEAFREMERRQMIKPRIRPTMKNNNQGDVPDIFCANKIGGFMLEEAD